MEAQLYNSEVLKLLRIIGGFLAAILLLLFGLFCTANGLLVASPQYHDISASPDTIYYKNYDVSTLEASEETKEIQYGYELFINTPKYLGPRNGNSEMAYSGNNLSCNNCHLLAGTKAYSAPLIGIINRFPQYRGREDKTGTIEERIDGCMERSLNGSVFPSSGREMTALVRYLHWLNRFAPEDGKIAGEGFLPVILPGRPVDLTNGKRVFQKHCVECHGLDGQGVFFEGSPVYQYPPLWGPDSFNNGAGMNRVITAAQFIKGNMPYGVTYLNPLLTDEEAYDVAGYINVQPRPEKENLNLDFPDRVKKPVSTPYPPYADPFSQEQHKKGPFQPIIDYYKETYGVKKRV